MRITTPVLRIVSALIPLGLTPLAAGLISKGILDFGGGCKDIVMVLPWLLWSVLYFIACIVLWIRRVPLVKSTCIAVIVSSALLVILFFGMYFFSKPLLGVS